MMDEKLGANEPATDTDADSSEPQISAREQALATEVEGLKKTQRSLQREVERGRKQGSDTRNLESRLQANEEALTFVADAIGKLAKAAELEGVDAGPVLDKLRARKPAAEGPSPEQQRAGAAIVALSAGAGVKQEDFEDAWQTDERFAQARIYWSLGQFDAAVEAARQGTTEKAAPKTYTEKELKEAVEDATTAKRRDAASAAPGTSTATANERTITAAEFAKLPADQRLAMVGDLRKTLRKE